MNHFTILLRNETIDFASYSPEDMQRILSDFDEWNAKMIREGRLIASGNLQNGTGKTIRAGNVVTDGPYSEAKEAIAGFFLIEAEDYLEATEIAAGCPFIPRGGSVEIRFMPQLEFEDAARPIMEEHARNRAEAKQNNKEKEA